MNESSQPVKHTDSQRGIALLVLGMLAGPVYIIVGLVQVLLRDGFDVRRHALSLLSNGEYGWIQTANFIVSGLMVIAGAVGVRRALRTRPAGLFGPILLAAYGLGLIGAGLFTADPAQGFPPGAESVESLSRSGVLHFVCGGIGFYAIIAACFVFARRHKRRGSPGLMWVSVLTGVGFFASFAAVASGSTSAAVMILFYVAIVWIWTWHTFTLLHVARDGAGDR